MSPIDRLGEAVMSLPESFSDTVAAIAVFADPVLAENDVESEWWPTQREWVAVLSTATNNPPEQR
jgi:hypothetical protein